MSSPTHSDVRRSLRSLPPLDNADAMLSGLAKDGQPKIISAATLRKKSLCQLEGATDVVFGRQRMEVIDRATKVAGRIEERSDFRLSLITDFRTLCIAREIEDAKRVRSEAEIAVDKYTRAEHLLGDDPAKVALADLDKERRLYTEAADLIHNAPAMREFLTTEKHEVVDSRSNEEKEARAASVAHQRAADAARQQETLRLKLEVARCRGQQTESMAEMRQTVEGFTKSEKKLLELRTLVSGQNRETECALAALRQHAPEEEVVEADGAIIGVWVLGLPPGTSSSTRASAGVTYHAAFCTGKQLEAEEWVSLKEQGQRITVEAAGLLLSQVKKTTTGAAHRAYRVSGASMQAVNGTYELAKGSMMMIAGAPSFVNERGVTLFRATLSETPELQITEASLHEKDANSLSNEEEIAGDPFGRDFAVLAKKGRQAAMAGLRVEQLERRAEARRQKEERGTTVSEEKTTMTFGMTAADAAALSADFDRVIPSKTLKANEVPPLCLDWVDLACSLPLTECRGRHYYVSFRERDRWIAKRQEKATELDRRALQSVCGRELLLEALKEAFKGAKDQYLAYSDTLDEEESSDEEDAATGAKTEEEEAALLEAYMTGGAAAAVAAPTRSRERALRVEARRLENSRSICAPLLELVDRLRMATVEAVEDIQEWRSYYARHATAAASKKGVDVGGELKKWISTIETEGARRVAEESPALVSKSTKWARGRLPSQRTIVTKFLGLFADQEGAEKAYDMAKPVVALERHVLEAKLPPRVVRKAPGGLHIVETRGSRPLRSLEAAVRKRVADDAPPPPAYLWNDGQNYLLKVLTDLDFLGSSGLPCLQLVLGDHLALQRNPLALDGRLIAAIEDEQDPDGGGTSSSTPNNEASQLVSSASSMLMPKKSPAFASQQQLLLSQSLPFLKKPQLNSLLFGGHSTLNSLATSTTTGTTPVVQKQLGSPSMLMSTSASVSFDRLTQQDDAASSMMLLLGLPTTEVVTRHRGGALIEWAGETRVVGEPGSAVELLDMHRVRGTLTALAKEAEMIEWREEKGAVKEEEEEDSSEEEEGGFQDLEQMTASSFEIRPRPRRRVLAVYESTEARLVVEQNREPLRGLRDGVFCRAEAGKWKGVGLGCRGPATKAYWFDRTRREEGERRREKRDRLAGLLRREAGRRVTSTRIALIEKLLGDAEQLRTAGRLKADAVRARTAIDRRLAAELFVKHLATRARGIARRKTAKERRREVEAAFALKLKKHRHCLATALAFTVRILDEGVKRAALTLTKPKHVSVLKIDGVITYRCVFSREHHDKVSLEARRRYIFNHPPGKISRFTTGEVTVPHRALRPVIGRDPGTLKLRHEHAPLEDIASSGYTNFERWKPPPESLLVVFYEPSTSRVCGIKMDNSKFRAALIQQRGEIGALARLEPVAQCDALLGYSPRRDRFDPLREERVLVDQHDNARCFRRACHSSRCEAVVRAAMAGDLFDLAMRTEEAAKMGFEDSVAQANTARRLWMDTSAHAQRILGVSRAELAVFDSQEDDEEEFLREDWRQSSDPFEDGSSWKVLRQKRSCYLDLKQKNIQVERSRSHVHGSFVDRSRQQTLRCRALTDLVLKNEAFERAAMAMEAAEDAANRASRRRQQSIDAVLCCLTVRRLAGRGKCAVWKKANWDTVIRTPKERSERAAWRSLNCATRRALVVRVPSKHLAKAHEVASRSVANKDELVDWLRRRLIVTVRQDSALGHLVVTAEREGRPGDCYSLLVSAKETQLLCLAMKRPDLALQYIPCKEQITLAKVAALREQRATEVGSLICSALELGTFSGKLRFGALEWSRRQGILARRLVFGDHDKEAEVLTGDRWTVSCDEREILVTRSSDEVALAQPSGRWFPDATIAKRSAMRGCLLLGERARIAGRNVLCHVYEHWGDLRFECYEPLTPSATYSVTATFPTLLRCSSDDARTAQLLRAVVVCDYPKSLLRHFVDRLDFVLPGEEERPSTTNDLLRPRYRWRRSPMQVERPRLIFHELESDRWRGPVYYKERCRVAGKIARLAVHLDGVDGRGLRIVIAEPTAPCDISASYEGPPLTLDLTSEALRAVCAGCDRLAGSLDEQKKHRRAERARRRSAVMDLASAGAASKRLTLLLRRKKEKKQQQQRLILTGEEEGSEEESEEDEQEHSDAVSEDTTDFDDEDSFQQKRGCFSDPLRREELCLFLIARLQIQTEDEASNSKVGEMLAKRRRERAVLGGALLDFDRWNLRSRPPLNADSTKAVEAIRASSPRATGGRQLCLGPVPIIEAEEDASTLRVLPWRRSKFEEYTARLGLDAERDFVVTLTKATAEEVRERSLQDEARLMGLEDARSRVVEDLVLLLLLTEEEEQQEHDVGGPRDARTQEIARRRRRRAALKRRKRHNRVPEDTGQLQAAIQVAAKKAMLNLRVAEGPQLELANGWSWPVQVVKERGVLLEQRAFMLPRGPWVVRCELLALTLRFEAYDPSTSTTLAMLTPLLCEEAVREALLLRDIPSGGDTMPTPKPSAVVSSRRRLVSSTARTSTAALTALSASVAASALTDALERIAEASAPRGIIIVEAAAAAAAAAAVPAAFKLRLAIRAETPLTDDDGRGIIQKREEKKKSKVVNNISRSRREELIGVLYPESTEEAAITVGILASAGYRFELSRLTEALSNNVELQMTSCFFDGKAAQMAMGAYYKEQGPRPLVNERATLLLRSLSKTSEEVVYGPAVLLVSSSSSLSSPSVESDAAWSVADELLLRDADLQLARKSVGLAVSAMRSTRLESVAEAREAWERRAKKRISRLAHRLRCPNDAHIIARLRSAAEACDAAQRRDPFEKAASDINNNENAYSTAMDLEHLEEAELHPWLLWRDLLIAHATTCPLPLASCQVPHCSRARAEMQAGDGDVSHCVSELLEVDAHDRDQTRPLRRRSRDPVEKRHHEPQQDIVHHNGRRFSFRDVRERLEETAVLPAVKMSRSPIHACVLSKEAASALATKVAESNRSRRSAKTTVPRSLLASLARKAVGFDARGSATGATSAVIADATFEGNSAFFEWLLSRVRLQQPKKKQEEGGVGRLVFDGEHAQRSMLISGSFVALRVSQPPPPSSTRTTHQVGGTQEVHRSMSLVSKREIHVEKSVASRLTDTVEETDRGLLVTVHVLGSCLALQLHLTREALLEGMIRPLLAVNKQLAAQLQGHLLDVLQRSDLAAWLLRRAPLLFELNRGELRLKSRRSVAAAIRAFTPPEIRQQDDATKIATVERELQRCRRKRSMITNSEADKDYCFLDEMSASSEEEEEEEEEEDTLLARLSQSVSGSMRKSTRSRSTIAGKSFQKRTTMLKDETTLLQKGEADASRMLLRGHRVAEARRELTRIRRREATPLLAGLVNEWPGMFAEERSSRKIRPYLASAWSKVKPVERAFGKKRVVLSDDEELQSVLLELLALEDSEDAHHDDGMALVEEDSTPLPIGLADFACHWQKQFGPRARRRAARVELRIIEEERIRLEEEELERQKKGGRRKKKAGDQRPSLRSLFSRRTPT